MFKEDGGGLSTLFFITVLNSVDCRPMVNTFTQHSSSIIFASAFFATGGGGVCVCARNFVTCSLHTISFC